MKWWKFRRLVFYLVDRALQGCFKPHAVVPNWKIVILCPGARFSKDPVTLRARNQIFKSKYKE